MANVERWTEIIGSWTSGGWREALQKLQVVVLLHRQVFIGHAIWALLL